MHYNLITVGIPAWVIIEYIIGGILGIITGMGLYLYLKPTAFRKSRKKGKQHRPNKESNNDIGEKLWEKY